jgi:hypothetical protein
MRKILILLLPFISGIVLGQSSERDSFVKDFVKSDRIDNLKNYATFSTNEIKETVLSNVVKKLRNYIDENNFAHHIDAIVSSDYFYLYKKKYSGSDYLTGKMFMDECYLDLKKIDSAASIMGHLFTIKKKANLLIKNNNKIVNISFYSVDTNLTQVYFSEIGYLYKGVLEFKMCPVYNSVNNIVLTDFILEPKSNLGVVSKNFIGIESDKYFYWIHLPIIYKNKYVADIRILYHK